MERREIPTTQAAGEMQEEDDQLQEAVAFSGAGQFIPPNLEPRQADRMHNNTIWPQNREISTTRPAGEMREDQLEGPVAFPRAGQSIPPNLVQRHLDRMDNDITGPQNREIPETWPAGGMREEDPWQARSGVGQSIPPNWEKPSADRIRETSQTRPDGGMQEEDSLRGAVAFTRAGQSIPPNFEQRQVDRTSNNITGPQKREIPKTWSLGDIHEEERWKRTEALKGDFQPDTQILDQRQTESYKYAGLQNREIPKTWPAGSMQEEDPLQDGVACSGVVQSIPPSLEQMSADRTSNNITGPQNRNIAHTRPTGGMQEEDTLRGAVAFTRVGQYIPPSLEHRQVDRTSNNITGPQKRNISQTRPDGGMQEEDSLRGAVAFTRVGQSIPPSLEQRQVDRASNNITGPQKREIPKTWSLGDMQEEKLWKDTEAFKGVFQPGKQILEQRQTESYKNVGLQNREIPTTRPTGGMQEEDPLRGAVAFTRVGQSIPPSLEQTSADRTSNNIIGPQNRETSQTRPDGGMQEEDPLRGAVAFTRVGQSIPPNLDQRQADRTSNNITVPQKREIPKTLFLGHIQEEKRWKSTEKQILDQRLTDRYKNAGLQNSEKVKENANASQTPDFSQQLHKYKESQEERSSNNEISIKTEPFLEEWNNVSTRRTGNSRLYSVHISDQVTAAIKAEAQDVPLELWTYEESQKERSSNDENSKETEVPVNSWRNGNQKTLRSAGSEDVHSESQSQQGGPGTSKGVQEEDARKGFRWPIIPKLEQWPADVTSDDITAPQGSEKVKEEAANISEAQNAAQEQYKYNESQKEGPSNDENSSIIEKQANGWAKVARRRRTGKTAGKYDVFIKSPGGTRLRSKDTLVKHINSKHANVNPEDFDFVLPSLLRKRGTCKPPKDINKENEDKASTLRGIKKERQEPPAHHAGDTQNTEKDPAVLDNVSDGGSLVFHDSIAKSKGKRTIKQCFSKTAMMNEDIPRKRIRSVRKQKRPALRDEQESVRSRASFKNKPHATSKVASQQDAVLAEETAGPSNVLCERQQNQQESQESNIEDRRMQLQSHYQAGQAMLWPRDVFSNINQDRLIFCLSLQSMLKELNEEWERQARDDIYSYLIRCRSKNRSGFSPD